MSWMFIKIVFKQPTQALLLMPIFHTAQWLRSVARHQLTHANAMPRSRAPAVQLWVRAVHGTSLVWFQCHRVIAIAFGFLRFACKWHVVLILEIQDSVVDAGNLSEEYLSKIITVVSTLKQLDQVQLEPIRIRMGSLKVLNLLLKHVHFLSNPSACTQTIQVNRVNTYYPWNFPLRGEKTSIWCLFTSQSS